MIISNTKNFIFIHIPKTGGMSIRNELQEYATVPVWAHNQYKVKGQKNKDLSKHVNVCTLKRYIKNSKWNDYFKFAFIRNPYDWMVSIYFYIKRDKTDSRYNIANKLNFKDFVIWFYNSDSKVYPIRNGQFSYIACNNKLEINKICRFETINNDFSYICKKIGINKNLKMFNKTKHLNYKQYYDNKTIDLVKRMFNKDLVTFGYSF